MDWQHPTGRNPERIAIVGLGPTQSDWHNAHVQYTPPLAEVDEVWTVNKGFRTVRCDLVFIMDDLVEEARISPRYGDDIAACPVPVITSTVDAPVRKRWPNVLQYPLDDVLKFWGAQLVATRTRENQVNGGVALQTALNECAYFNNSIPYMLAYAGLIGVRHITMFGCDYTFPGTAVREADRANAEYWAAALQFGLGVTFTFSPRTTFLSRDKWRTFYGFNGRQPY